MGADRIAGCRSGPIVARDIGAPLLDGILANSGDCDLDTILAAADLTPALPPDLPLRITRSWLLDSGTLVMRFTLTDTSLQPSRSAHWASRWSSITCSSLRQQVARRELQLRVARLFSDPMAALRHE
jgi:hypothetical protein